MALQYIDGLPNFVCTETIKRYENKKTGHKELQLIVDLPSEVQTRETGTP